jgi:metallo-beta-lactamase family protein
MKIQFIGATRTVTGSMHLIKLKNMNILLDCGMFQGRRKESFEKNKNLDFIEPTDIHYVILSHAHIDHSGNIPQLTKNGFSGTIFSTYATRDLTNTMLLDSAYIQKKEIEFVNKKRYKNGQNPFEVLYNAENVIESMQHFNAVAYRKEYCISSDVSFIFYDAGHILGSAITVLNIKENGRDIRIAFTGDLGRPFRPILNDPQLTGNVHYLITESTYGARYHKDNEENEKILENIIKQTYKRNGKIIVPAFSLGRTQDLVFMLHKLIKENRIPMFPIFVDSPLSTNVTSIFRNHPECYDTETMELLMTDKDPFGFKNLTYISSIEESKKLNGITDTCMIISASGMCESGRVLHHLANNIENEKNTVLMTGYCAQDTLGRKIIEKQPKLKILGDEYKLKSEVVVMENFSAHADRDELLGYIAHMNRAEMQNIFLVHGEYESQLSFKEGLKDIGFQNIMIPEAGQEIHI